MQGFMKIAPSLKCHYETFFCKITWWSLCRINW